MSGWQPIETAPDTGEEVIVWGGRYSHPTVRQADGQWWRMAQHDGMQSAPTHWMPLPPAPVQA